jgi:hypothetical protein
LNESVRCKNEELPFKFPIFLLLLLSKNVHERENGLKPNS